MLALAPAGAQAQGSVPSIVPAGLGGPIVPGVCLISRDAVLTSSKVAVYASERIRQITAEAQAEVDAMRKPVDAQVAALRAQAPKMTPQQIRAQEQALSAKLAPVQALAEQRRREVEKTRIDALATISAQVQPLVAAAYGQKGCGLLFDRNSLLGGNFGNDITAAVVTALDGKITSFAIQRATLPASTKP